MWTPIFATGGINGAGHYWGYRNFNTSDDSTNLGPVGIIIGGEELHNNHHAFPTAAKFSLKPWEFDIGWMYIKIFSIFGQIKVKRLAVKTVVDSPNLDLDSTVGYDLLKSKLTVITNYTSEVLKPILKIEIKNAKYDIKKMLKMSRETLSRQPSRISDQDINRLKLIFKECTTLETVYDLKNKLYDILYSRNIKHENFLQTLNDWREEASSKGIDSLKVFSNSLKGYKVV